MGVLRRQFKKAMVVPNRPESAFLPDSVLMDLMTEKNVSQVLAEYQDENKAQLRNEIPRLTSYICAYGAMKIFATLVWDENVGLIDEFFENKFTDDMLPLDDTASIFRTGWTDAKIDTFCDSTQWRFLAPVFHDGRFEYEFNSSTRLPFLPVSGDSQPKMNSNFSTVEKRLIHNAHLQTVPEARLSRATQGGHTLIAVKELKNPLRKSEEDFEEAARSEAEVLIRMRELNHPHLIKAIAYYTKEKGQHAREKEHVILFPWAGGGNLRDFWNKGRPRKLDGDFLSWAFGQFCGLAGALDRLHVHSPTQRTCRHGDLKPENILCFENKKSQGSLSQPVLVIADVGLAKVHVLETEMRDKGTKTLAGTITYEPPEAVLWMNKPRSRRYDIWSMGCIYLEFLVWILYDKEGLDKFGHDITEKGDSTGHKFFDIVAGDARIKPSVQTWIDYIRSDRQCPKNTAVRQLLELIATRLLVVDLGRRPTLLSENNSRANTPYQNETSDIKVLVRQPTGDTDVQDPINLNTRAAADEMYEKLEKITRDALDTKSQIQWMDFQAPSSGGPTKQHGHRLAPAQGRKGH